MGWNGSGGGSAPVKPKETVSKPSPVRGIVAGLVVVALAAAAYFLLFSGDKAKKPVREDAKKGLIKEVSPAKVATNTVVVAKPKEDIRELPNGQLMKYKKDGTPAWMYPRDKPAKLIVTNAAYSADSFYAKHFRHGADMMIAELLHVEPGESFVGDSKRMFGTGFIRSFKKSLEEPFMVNPDDTDAVKALKHAVAEVKGDLKARMDAGEDICKVMEQARDEMKQLGIYKQDLQKMVRDQIKGGEISADEAKDLVAAANKMLADRGMKPMTMPKFLIKKLEVNAAKRKGEEK